MIGKIMKKRLELKLDLLTVQEKYMFLICFILTVFNIALWIPTQPDIDIRGYLTALLIVGILLVIGLLYRHVRVGGERIAMSLICTSALLLFSNLGSIFNYLLLPFSGELIDDYLAQLDAAMGFNWLSFLQASSEWPTLSLLLGWSYNSTLIQVVVVIVLLGFKGHVQSLYDFIQCFMLSALITIGFWFFFPSFGPTSMYSITDELVRLVNPVVGNEYGLYLRMLKTNPVVEISPTSVQGIIAMPSYHTVMALLTCYAVSRIPVWRWLFFVINALVIIAVPLHGGHHLVDVFGGVIVSLLVVIYIRRRRPIHSISAHV